MGAMGPIGGTRRNAMTPQGVPENVSAETFRQLRLLIEHARATTPYFAARLPTSTPRARNVSDLLSTIPLLDRTTVRRERIRLLSTAGDPTTWRAVRSTGTTGEPVEVVIDQAARSEELHALATHLDRWADRPDWWRETVVHLVLHPGAASVATLSPWQPDAHLVKWNLLRAWQADDDVFLNALGYLEGRAVTAQPSVAALLASRVLEAGHPGAVRLAALVLSGESASADLRRRLAMAFGCTVSSLYTLAEAGVVGDEC